MTLNQEEINKFNQIAETWWDPNGPFKPLHIFNPARLSYLKDHIKKHFQIKKNETPLDSLNILDMGCGGGMIAEPLARLGANVTGVDGSEKAIGVAKAHASEQDLNIHYIHGSLEKLEAKPTYDVITCLEMIEHVDNPGEVLHKLVPLLKPGGLIFISTLNKTLKSYMMAIVGAEYVLRWLPRGTHQWSKFMPPSAVVEPLQEAGAKTIDITGFIYNPLTQTWKTSQTDFDVNYMVCATKEK